MAIVDPLPLDYCADCVELVAALGGKDTAAFKLPCDVRFDVHNSRVFRCAIWRAGDHVELLHWLEATPRHMIVVNTSRRKQARVWLCEKQLRPAIKRAK